MPPCVRFRLSLIVLVIVVLYVVSSIKILAEYERGVVFRLGKLLPQPRDRVSSSCSRRSIGWSASALRTVVLDVPPQDVITRDNVSVKVNAVVYFRVMDPRRAIVEVGELSTTRHRSCRRRRCAACWGRSISTICCRQRAIILGNPGQ